MDRHQLLVIAVALMCVTAMPGSAAAASSNEELVVGAQQTTNSDFSNAKTLENVSVSDGAVKLDQGGVFSDGFEKDTLDRGTPDNWEVARATEEENVTDSVSYEGSQSWYVNDANTSRDMIRPAEQPYGSTKTKNVSAAIYPNSNTGGSGPDPQFRLLENGTLTIYLTINDGSELIYKDSSGTFNTITTAPNKGEWTVVKVFDVDPSTDTFSVYWETPSSSGTATGLDMQNGMSEGYDETRIGVYSGDAYFDDFKIGGSTVQRGVYEQNYTITNSQKANLNLTLQNVSATVTVTGVDGSNTQLNQTTFTQDGNHSVTWSEYSGDTVEVNVTYEKSGSGAVGRLDDVSILFTNHAPEVDNSSASPNSSSTNNENVDLSINVSDQEFSTVQGDNVTVTAYVDGSAIGSKTISSNQTVTFTATDLSDGSHSWHVELEDEYGLTSQSDTFSFEVNHYPPSLDNANASPQDNSEQATREITLSIPLEDIDFAEPSGDEVAVEFFVDGDSVGTINVTSNGTVEKTVEVTGGGDHTWHVKATDEYGQTTTSDTFEFKVPATVTFRNEKNTSEILDNVQVNVTAYYGDETVRRNVSDGTLNLTGFPVDQPIIFRVSGENYTTRTAVIESVYDQSNIYLLKKDVPTYEIRFDLQDATGEYPRDDTVLFVERDLKLNGTVEWRIISGDNFGVQGVPVTLEQDERYRLRVRNLETGATATIGAFTPVQSETVTISPGSATIDIVDSESDYGWSVSENETGQYILFEYYDDVNETDSLKLTIHERFNNSNVLVDNETFTDANDIVYQIPMTANETNKTWMAELYVERNGNVTHFREPITSGASNILPANLGEHWASGVGVFIMLITGMAFSELNRSAGAVATALAGGMLWQLGFLSTVTTAPAIVLTIGISVLYHYRTGGDPA